LAEPILEIVNLRVRFGAVTAVDGACVPVTKGSFTSLVGASGSGKSVTALSVCRLDRQAAIEGDIFWTARDGNVLNLTQLTENALRSVRGRGIAYVFQDPAASLNPVLRIGEQVSEAFRAHGLGNARQARAKALELLQAVRLPDPERAFRAYPHELSGGMRQRATIAAALSADPALLIADEPTTALDPTIEAEILSLLAEFRAKRGLTVLFITHDLALARAYSDRIHVMRAGRVVESLLKEGRFEPANPYARALLAASAFDAAPKTPIGGVNA